MAMLALGLYTFFICIYGFLISTRESRGLISLMAVLIGIAFLGQVFSIFTAFELRFKITSEVLPIADENMQRYLSDETVKYNWDWMQRDLRCCRDTSLTRPSSTTGTGCRETSDAAETGTTRPASSPGTRSSTATFLTPAATTRTSGAARAS